MRYVFADFELDADRAELRREGQVVPVEPQVFDLLNLLVGAGDRIVTRDEIFDRIWGDRIVSDAALSSRVRDARKAIGDDGKAQKYIRTIQRRGLRFVGAAQKIVPGVVAAQTPALAPTSPQPAPDSFERPAVAVLPFDDLTSDGRPSPLADCLTMELSAALSAWRYFPVIAHTSAARFRGSPLSAADIGAALKARYLVSGSIRNLGNRLKVQVTLTDTETDTQIWADRIAQDVAGVLDLEEEVAALIATAVSPELEGAEARRIMHKAPADLTAWDMSMRAAWLLSQRNPDVLSEAEALATAAANHAPGWVLPYTLIAMSRFHQAMSGFSVADSGQAFQPTLEAARRALEVDQTAWIAHALTAVGELWSNRTHDRALLHVEKALELNPSAAINYHFGGCITGFSGDPTKARTYQERICRVDPVYPYRAVIEADLGLWHMLDGNWAEADDHLARAQSWDPAYGRALQRRMVLSGLTGNRDAAQAAARRLADLGQTLDPHAIIASYPFRRDDHREMFLQGLRFAGFNI
ncbi:winged helix-turn-helix domain-containing protein [Chachezhania sediminis]|uniref:winged helix-turn-helix domain-containing protein n=1 Tax=Chachezhania sediminis TaxID=2599291 RepID=UPI00131D7BA9|nr:winged helix-turn-helix domain-containing protein [Chachezhania sediminis]